MEGSEVFDTIIIGGGPAGLSAAIYAVRKSLKVLLVAKIIGGQTAFSGSVENYLGFSPISGADLVLKFREEVERFKNTRLWIEEGVEVVKLSGSEGNFAIQTTDGKEFKGKTIIIASGRTPKMLGVRGERELLGKGVAICATCDAPLFRGKDVAVVGGGNSALDAAFSLMKLASSVLIISNSSEVAGDNILLENIKSSQNVRILNNQEVLEIQGSSSVDSIKIRDKVSGQEQTLPINGVFVEIGWAPSANFDNLTQKNETGEIIVDEYGRTSVEGIWAAGDINSLRGGQIIIAAGEGAKTALAVAEHISKVPHVV